MADMHAWITDIAPDIIGVTETWADEDILDKEFMIPGYDLFHCDRPVDRHMEGVLCCLPNQLFRPSSTSRRHNSLNRFGAPLTVHGQSIWLLVFVTVP